MRYLFLGGLLACLLIAPAAMADPSPCNDRVAKSDSHVLTRPAHDRQGGDTIAEAMVIPSIPYTDTGATCDNADDYDEVCPYTGSTAPDVVYSFTPDHGVEVVVDLDGSEYDTKLYIYDENLNLVACNDDYYSDYVSCINNVELVGRMTYYIVVDGWGGDCGAYVLNVYTVNPCSVMCPPGATLEGEPALYDGYEDDYNGGCCGSEYGNPFQTLSGRDNNTLIFCGNSGWYDYQGMSIRDTDWFTLTLGPSGVLEVAMSPEQSTFLFELGPTDCNSVGVLQNVLVDPCETGSLTITGEPGSEVWIWTGPSTFEPPGGFEGFQYAYVLWLDGIAPHTPTAVPDGPLTAPRSLSTVKGLFK